MNLKLLFISFILFVICVCAYSDPAIIQIAGGTVTMHETHTNVELQNEDITIALGRDEYRVSVKCHFINRGEAVTMLVGFPQWSLYTNKPPSKFDNFSFIVNGVSYQFTIKDVALEESGYGRVGIKILKWYYATVDFPANTVVTIENSYNCQYADGRYGNCEADYLYGTGRNWNGDIGSIKINLTINNIKMLDYVISLTNNYSTVQTSKNQFVFVINNIEPDQNDRLIFFLQRL